jgi:hypothetical protein
MYQGALARPFAPLGRRGDAASIPDTPDDRDSLVLEETARYGGFTREVNAKVMPAR